jgi:hypothetical protein
VSGETHGHARSHRVYRSGFLVAEIPGTLNFYRDMALDPTHAVHMHHPCAIPAHKIADATEIDPDIRALFSARAGTRCVVIQREVIELATTYRHELMPSIRPSFQAHFEQLFGSGSFDDQVIVASFDIAGEQI